MLHSQGQCGAERRLISPFDCFQNSLIHCVETDVVFGGKKMGLTFPPLDCKTSTEGCAGALSSSNWRASEASETLSGLFN